ncbi:hypothetical protein KQX54_017205 [Cotesia glomerata]|uniref:Uncharacterized protein n=1 Tax=Cotesia glomerata TaxID=32391 RepID=A0AAV7HYB5_COTGL|nr:hypothetical protein KQX54_017205 [Cotesia glomerata]
MDFGSYNSGRWCLVADPLLVFQPEAHPRPTHPSLPFIWSKLLRTLDASQVTPGLGSIDLRPLGPDNLFTRNLRGYSVPRWMIGVGPGAPSVSTNPQLPRKYQQGQGKVLLRSWSESRPIPADDRGSRTLLASSDCPGAQENDQQNGNKEERRKSNQGWMMLIPVARPRQQKILFCYAIYIRLP